MYEPKRRKLSEEPEWAAGPEGLGHPGTGGAESWIIGGIEFVVADEYHMRSFSLGTELGRLWVQASMEDFVLLIISLVASEDTEHSAAALRWIVRQSPGVAFCGSHSFQMASMKSIKGMIRNEIAEKNSRLAALMGGCLD